MKTKLPSWFASAKHTRITFQRCGYSEAYAVLAWHLKNEHKRGSDRDTSPKAVCEALAEMVSMVQRLLNWQIFRKAALWAFILVNVLGIVLSFLIKNAAIGGGVFLGSLVLLNFIPVFIGNGENQDERPILKLFEDPYKGTRYPLREGVYGHRLLDKLDIWFCGGAGNVSVSDPNSLRMWLDRCLFDHAAFLENKPHLISQETRMSFPAMASAERDFLRRELSSLIDLVFLEKVYTTDDVPHQFQHEPESWLFHEVFERVKKAQEAYRKKMLKRDDATDGETEDKKSGLLVQTTGG